jgi:metal-responsive CopG/Arc/MetJ family transcriptional regulator
MAAISLKLPSDLAQESKAVAEKIGITRAELIRQALRNELDKVKARIEREAMAEALEIMRDDSSYITQSEELIEGFSERLPEETQGWWQG